MRCTVPNCRTMRCTVTNCRTMRCTVPNCRTMRCTVTNCRTMRCTVTNCRTMRCTVTNCRTMRCTVKNCRTMRCTVPNIVKFVQEIAVLCSSFKYKTRVTFQSFVIEFLPIYIYSFKKEFVHLIYSRQHHQTVQIKEDLNCGNATRWQL